MASFDLSNKDFHQDSNKKSKIAGIILISICSLAFLILFTSFFPFLNCVLLGLLGLFAYPFFIVAFTIGIALINNKKYVMPAKYIVLILSGIILILAILNLIILGRPDITFFEYLGLSYSAKYTGGGLLVGLLVAPLLYLLGLAGAIIIFSILLIIDIALIIDFLNTIKVYGKEKVIKNKHKNDIKIIDIEDQSKVKKQQKKLDKMLKTEQKHFEEKHQHKEEFNVFLNAEDEEENLEAKKRLGLIEGNLDSEKSGKQKPKSMKEYLLTPPEIDLSAYSIKKPSTTVQNINTTEYNQEINRNIDILKQPTKEYESFKPVEEKVNAFSSDFMINKPVVEPKINAFENSSYVEKSQANISNYSPNHKENDLKPEIKPHRTFAQLEIEETQKRNIEPPKPIYRRPPNYDRPSLDLLEYRPVDLTELNEDVEMKKIHLENALETFGINARVIGIVVGPSVTRFELEMPPGISVKKIVAHKDDISLALASRAGLRIEAPIPGKSAVGIELPNDKISMVSIREILDSSEFIGSRSPVTFALGKDINGAVQICNLVKMPHLLVAGATNSGKSIFLNALIISMLYKSSPDELKFILIDPKRVEFSMYNGLPHMILPKVITDTEKANNALTWAINEMERRYNIFAEERLRNLEEYNNLQAVISGEKPKIPYIVIVIDEFNDLMSVMKKEIEEKVKRLAQKARAAGIHLVLATQRPSVDVITGTIKTNFPSRITFALTSFADSKTILDQGGAENLLGKGDMLYLPSDANFPKRIQGCYVSNEEVNNVVEYIKETSSAEYDEEIAKLIDNPNANDEAPPDPYMEPQILDQLSVKCLKFIIENGQASISSLQRRFSIGFNKAGRIIDILTNRGYISRPDGMKPREVYLTLEDFEKQFGEVEI